MIMLLVQAPLSVGNLTLFDRQGLSISSGNSAHVLTVISQVNYIALCTDIISSSLRVLATFSVWQVCLNMTALLNRNPSQLQQSVCLPDTTQAFSVHKAKKILHIHWHFTWSGVVEKLYLVLPKPFMVLTQGLGRGNFIVLHYCLCWPLSHWTYRTS